MCMCMKEQGTSIWEIFQIKKGWNDNNYHERCLSVPSAVQIGIQLTKLIRDIHKLGYLHLDIKPDNILIDKNIGTHLCLIDFGISEKYLD